jgi:hypothetical protein
MQKQRLFNSKLKIGDKFKFLSRVSANMEVNEVLYIDKHTVRLTNGKVFSKENNYLIEVQNQ